MVSKYDENRIRLIKGRLDKPVVLIGLMGVGKTRIGRALARALHFKFVDSDFEIEKAAGMEISDIFSSFGEAYFRDGERRVISRLMEGEVKVIATGGGAVMTPETAEMLWEGAVTIWLKANLDVMVERTSRNDKRPLLQKGDPKAILQEMVEKRYPVYEKADIVVESYNAPTHVILKDVLEKLELHLGEESKWKKH